MNYFRRKALGYVPCMDGGGGGSGGGGGGSSTNTSYNVSVQPELMPYATDIAKKAQDLTASNYTPYQGQRIADFNPAQQQVQGETMGMQTPDQYYQGSQATRMAGLGSLMAGQNYNDMATNPYAVQDYMSPYMQNVVDTQKQQAMLDYQRGTAQSEKANAARAGAFGGSRQAILQGMNQEALNRQLGQIQAAGTQDAFKAAQQSMQYGSDLGLRGYGQAGQMAGQLAGIGGAQQQADLARLQAQGAVGGQQQALQQQQLSQNYQDFLKQQEFPYSQLSFYNSMIRGLAPVMPTTTQTYAANPSSLNQVASLGLGAYGLSNMFGRGSKEGGAIKAYAAGGGIGELARQEAAAKYAPQDMLQSSMQTNEPFMQPVAKQALDWQNGYTTAMQGQEAQQSMQQPSVLERMRQQQQVNPEMQGLGATGADVGGFADGGIIGFAEGGATGSWDAVPQAPSIYDILRRREQRGLVPTPDVHDPLPPGMSLDLDAMRKWREEQRNKYAVQGPPSASAPPAPDPEMWGVPYPTKPQGTQAASKKAAAATGAGKSSASTKLAESVLKPKDEAGISSLKTPTLEEDIANVGKYADAASALTKKERDALEAAESARKTRAEEGKERRLDTAKGLAALQAAQALTQVGKPGITAFGEALGAAGKTGAEYQANEEKIQSELEKADIAHKQGILALRKGDVETGTKMAEKRDAMLMKAEELKIMDMYRRGMIGIEEAKVKLAELELPSKISMHEAMAAHHRASGAAAGAGRGALTPAVMASYRDKANDNIQNKLRSDVKLQMEVQRNPALFTQMVQQEFMRLVGSAETAGMPGAQLATLPQNAQVVR